MDRKALSAVASPGEARSTGTDYICPKHLGDVR
jgi:hypothetical protein